MINNTGWSLSCCKLAFPHSLQWSKANSLQQRKLPRALGVLLYIFKGMNKPSLMWLCTEFALARTNLKII